MEKKNETKVQSSANVGVPSTPTPSPAMAEYKGQVFEDNTTEVAPIAHISGNNSFKEIPQRESLGLEYEVTNMKEMIIEMQEKEKQREEDHKKMAESLRLGILPGNEFMLELSTNDIDSFQLRRQKLLNSFRRRWDMMRRIEMTTLQSLFEDHKSLENEATLAMIKQQQQQQQKESTQKFESDESGWTESKGLVIGLNKVSWVDFKVEPKNPKPPRFIIDVLDGEPKIDIDLSDTSWWASGYYRPRLATQKSGGTLEDFTGAIVSEEAEVVNGAASLPERIRINSRYIIQYLHSLRGEKPSPEHLTSRAVVMTRPFKGLVYHDKDIRQKVQELKKATSGSFDTSATQPQRETSNDEKLDDASKLTWGQRNQVQNAKAIGQQGSRNDHLRTEDGSNEDPLVLLKHLECLVKFMDTEIQAKKDYFTSDSCQKISFTDLWLFFSPGDDIIRKDGCRAYRIIGVTSPAHRADVQQLFACKPRMLPKNTLSDPDSESDSEDEGAADSQSIKLYCVYIDFDGKRVGPVQRTFEIQRYEGYRPVTSLEVFPLRFYKEEPGTGKTALRQRLIDRGRMFIDVATISHMHYIGPTIDSGNNVDSQVVIDFEEACPHFAQELRPRLDGDLLIIPPWQKDRRSSSIPDRVCKADCCKSEQSQIQRDSYAEKQRNEEYMISLMPRVSGQEPSVAIFPRRMDAKEMKTFSEREFLIMSERVFGFVLRSHNWAMFDLTYITPMVRAHQIASRSTPSYTHVNLGENSDKIDTTIASDEEQLSAADRDQSHVKTAFDQLVLPQGHKKMILSLVSQHYRDKSLNPANEQVDIVRGKEGVSEVFGKCLYQISCGDLGTTAKDVEHSLETIFCLASRWNCVLLIDEAEVFLAARDRQDFRRNGMVTVFLRMLEYYSGLLFLTTNRVGDIDEAFASRIHISLYYPQLDLDSTLEVFKRNLQLIRDRFRSNDRKIKIHEESILDSASTYWRTEQKMRLNGRQIHNVCQKAVALADFYAQGGNYLEIKDADGEVELTAEHIELMSSTHQNYLAYSKDVKGFDADRVAKTIGIRAMESAKKQHVEYEPLFERIEKLDQESHRNKTAEQALRSIPTVLSTPVNPVGGSLWPPPSAMGTFTSHSVPNPTSTAPYAHYQPAAAAPPHSIDPGAYFQPQIYYPTPYGQPPGPGYVIPNPGYVPSQRYSSAPPADLAAQDPKNPTWVPDHPGVRQERATAKYGHSRGGDSQ